MDLLKQLGNTIVLPPVHQQKIVAETNGMREQYIKEHKLDSDLDQQRNEARMKNAVAENRFIEEYLHDQHDSVTNNWNLHYQNIAEAYESDNFIENYLRGTGDAVYQVKSKTIADVIESDNLIQNYLNIPAASMNEVFKSEAEIIDNAVQSDQFIQAYLDDNHKENVFEAKAQIIADAVESDILLERYLL